MHSSPQSDERIAASPLVQTASSCVARIELKLSAFAKRPAWRRSFWVIAFALLSLNLLEFPHHTYDTTHDLSSHATFEYYAANKFQFGTQVYQNVGPYGYVHYAYSYIGYLHWQKTALRNITRVVLVLLLLWSCRYFRSPLLKLWWLASFFVFLPIGDHSKADYLDVDEDYAYLAIYVGALYLLQSRRERAFWITSAAVLGFLAFTALTKHTCFVLAAFVVAIATAHRLLRKEFALASANVVVFAAFLSVWWVFAGQDFIRLPQFVSGIFAFSGGYNEAMAINEPMSYTLVGVAIVLLMAAGSAINWLSFGQTLAKPVIESGFLYVMWKHGYVRADSIHLTILFYACLFMATPYFFARVSDTSVFRPRLACIPLRHAAAVLFVCAIVTGFSGFYLVIPDCRYDPARLAKHFNHNLSWLLSPQKKTSEMQAALAKAKAETALPQVKRIVGRSTIDFFGYEPGYLLLNDLNYVSRPMPISFAASNKKLLSENERFYRDPARAPQFVLCRMGSVDDRFIPQDDAPALKALLDNYHPALVENDFLLLKRNPELEPQMEKRFLGERTVRIGERIMFTKSANALLWLEADIERTWLGKAASFLYKPGPCYIGYQFSANEPMTFSKFVTSMASSGMILDPILFHESELFALYAHDASLENFRRLDTIVFVCDPRDRIQFNDKVRIRFYETSMPPLRIKPRAAAVDNQP